jgi:hypothetical protein
LGPDSQTSNKSLLDSVNCVSKLVSLSKHMLLFDFDNHLNDIMADWTTIDREIESHLPSIESTSNINTPILPPINSEPETSNQPTSDSHSPSNSAPSSNPNSRPTSRRNSRTNLESELRQRHEQTTMETPD